MSIEQFITVLKARWKLALSVQLLIVLTAVGISLSLPRQYTAAASVLVDVKTPDPIAGTSFSGPMLAAHMANEANVIQSERVMLRALVAMGLMDDPKMRAKWLEETDGVGDFPVWLATRLSKDLDIKPSREGSIMTVLYNSADRVFAATMASVLDFDANGQRIDIISAEPCSLACVPCTQCFIDHLNDGTLFIHQIVTRDV